LAQHSLRAVFGRFSAFSGCRNTSGSLKVQIYKIKPVLLFFAFVV